MQYQSPIYSPQQGHSPSNGMRHRPVSNGQYSSNNFSNNNNTSNGLMNNDSKYSKSMKRRVVRNIDLFPKIESDLTVQTDQGGKLSVLGIFLAVTLIIAEWSAWRSTNSTTVQTVVVDTSLNKKMRVDLNITFPALHCNDLHLDLMDVAGDVQIDVEDTMTKKRLHKRDMMPLSDSEVDVRMSNAHKKELEAKEAIKKTMAKDYCGPCYGAGEDDQCCNFCDDVLAAYKKKSWHVEQVRHVAEQCVREHKTGAKAMSRGEGCQISGYMTFKRLNGNFHIAMGEGVERNGHFIHTFLPDDMENFNASHIIHDLRFGPVYETDTTLLGEMTSLNGVEKIVKKSDGTTGTFQYYIKIVPTIYKGRDLVNSLVTTEELEKLSAELNDANAEPVLETNRFFSTERFVPLMAEELTEENYELGDMIVDATSSSSSSSIEWDDDAMGWDDDDGRDDDDDDAVAGAKVGGNSGTQHSHHHNHRTKQQVLPGVFFIYQIYPFAVEVSNERVPLIHLLIRIMATVGGLFTIVGWLDAYLYSRGKKYNR